MFRLKSLLFILLTTSIWKVSYGQDILPLDTLTGFDSYKFGTPKANCLPLDSDSRTQGWYFLQKTNPSPYFLGFLCKAVEVAFKKDKLSAIHLTFLAAMGGGTMEKYIGRAIDEYGMFTQSIITPDGFMAVWIGDKVTLTIRFTRGSFLSDDSYTHEAKSFVMDATFIQKTTSTK